MQRTPKNGRKLKLSGKNGVNIRQQHKRDVSSTPIQSHRLDSPSFGDTSPFHDAWEPSPIRFMATQDGSHGENDVIWNYYSPKSDKEPQNLNTPIRRKRTKRHVNEFSPITRLPPKRKPKEPTKQNVDYFQGLKEELLAINKGIQEKISAEKNGENIVTDSPGLISRRDSDDMFEESPVNALILNKSSTRENSPVVLKHLALRNNICDKIKKCESEGLESDDSMNECLLMASQMAEEVIKTDHLKTKHLLHLPKKDSNTKIGTPKLNDDSFDNLICNMDDFDIEVLSQAPASKVANTRLNTPRRSTSISSYRSSNFLKGSESISKNYHRNINLIDKVKNDNFAKDVNRCSGGSETSAKENDNGCNVNDFSDITNLLNSSALNESKQRFARHNSMPESPSEPKSKKVKGSSSGGFIRHNTMPASDQQAHRSENEGSSPPMRCTQDEIMKKRQAAKEKLLARRNAPLSARINMMPPSNINNLFNKNIPHQPMTRSAVPRKNFIDTNDSRKSSDSTQTIRKTTSEGNIKNQNINNNQSGTVNNFKYKTPKGNTLLKEINIQEEIERKRKEALQKLQMKRVQSQTILR